MSEITASILCYSYFFVEPFLLLSKVFASALLAVLCSVFFGICFGVTQTQRFKVPVLSFIISYYTYLIFSLSEYWQYFIAYLILPELFGLDSSYYATEAIALSIYLTAQVIEIVQVNINSFSQEEIESYSLLGFSRFQMIRYIIAPKIYYSGLPAFFPRVELLLRYIALTSVFDFFQFLKASDSLGLNISLSLNLIFAITLVYLGITVYFLEIFQILLRKYGVQHG